MSRFAIQQSKFNGVLYPGISGWNVTPGDDINSDATDGTVHETAHHGMATAPTADLTTRDLGFLAVLNGSTDAWLKAMDGSNGLECIGGKANSAAPGYASGSVHVSRKMIRGVLLGTGISWSKRGKSELTLRGMGTSANGTTPALTPGLIALPAAPTPDFGWKCTGVTIGGDTITAVDSVGLTCDHRAQFEYYTDLPEPTDVLMAGVNGTVMWRASASIGDCDLGSGTGAVSFVFKRLATGGVFSAAASSILTITYNSPWSIEDTVGGQASASMTRALTVRPRYNGTTLPVTWAFS